MSGLSEVPRIPKRISTRNGSDPRTTAPTAAGSAPSSAARRGLEAKKRRADDRQDGHGAEPGPADEARSVASQATAHSKPSPTAGSEGRAFAVAAGAEDRLTDDERSPQDECQRNVGAEHRAASLQPRA